MYKLCLTFDLFRITKAESIDLSRFLYCFGNVKEEERIKLSKLSHKLISVHTKRIHLRASILFGLTCVQSDRAQDTQVQDGSMTSLAPSPSCTAS